MLVGPSGCGESTLLNCIAGLEPITSGDIAIDGRSVCGLHPSKRDIAMVFQSYALYPNMTVAGNIAFGMEIRVSIDRPNAAPLRLPVDGKGRAFPASSAETSSSASAPRRSPIPTAPTATRAVVEGGRAAGAEVAAGNGLETRRAAREVIVSSGAIGSPKLLMRSGIGPASHLRSAGVAVKHDLPGVGINLQDHLDLFVIRECTGDLTYDGVAKPHRTLWAGLRYLPFRSGSVASSLFETGGFWYADPDARSPDIQFHLGSGSGIEAGVERLRNAGVTLNSAYLHPRSRGAVRLAPADPASAPLIDPDHWADPHDRRMSLGGLRIAREIMSPNALKPFVLAERLPGPALRTEAELFDYGCRNAKTGHRPVGTCRMGSDAEAVVDLELRVKGLESLRVRDSSILPRVPSCNTDAPTIMAGEKGADIIRGLAPLPPAVFSHERNDQRPRARLEVS